MKKKMEFFTPFNLFYQPVPLIVLELIFWAVIAISEALAIAAVLEWKSYRGKRDSLLGGKGESIVER